MVITQRSWTFLYAGVWMLMLFLWLCVALAGTSSPLTWFWNGPLPNLSKEYFSAVMALPLCVICGLFPFKKYIGDARHERYVRRIWLLWFALLFSPYLSHSYSSFNYLDRSSRTAQYLVNILVWLVVFYFVIPFFYRLRYTRFIFISASLIIRRIARIPARRYYLLSSLLIAALAVTISYTWFSFTPFANDSVVQYVHAKVMATGHATWHLEGLFYPIGWSLYRYGEWFSQYMPVHMMLQAVMHLLHAPWLLNPLLSMLSVLLICYMTCRMYGPKQALLIPVLFITSLYMMVISASMMNHPTGLLGTVLCILGIYQAVELKKPRWAVLSVLGLAMVAGSRTANAPGLFAAVILWGSYYILPNWKSYKRTIAAGLIAGIIALLGMALYNWMTVGDPLMFAYEIRQAKGVGAMVATAEKRPFGLLIRYMSRLQDISIRLYDWPVPSLFFVAFLMWRQPRRKENILLMMVILLSSVCYLSAYDRLFMPRYLYEVTGACILVMSAAGMIEFITFLKAQPRLKTVPSMHIAAGMFIAFICLFAAAWQKSYNLRMQKYAYYYWEGNPGAVRVFEENIKKPALVYVVNDYRFFWVMPSYPPQKDDEVIYARWIKNFREEKTYLKRYPKRYVYYTNLMFTSLIREPLNDEKE